MSIYSPLNLICDLKTVTQLWWMSGPAAGTLEMQIAGIKANEKDLCQKQSCANTGAALTS